MHSRPQSHLGTRTRGPWRHRIRKSEILGLLMASICSSRSVNVSKFRCCKPFNTQSFNAENFFFHPQSRLVTLARMYIEP